MWTTDIIRNEEQFGKLRKEWNGLLENSRLNTIFLTWEWISSWWEIFAEQKKLFIVTVKNNNGDLIGIAPLLIHKVKYYGFPLEEMTFIGKGHSDRQDFIIRKHEEEEGVVREILSAIYRHSKKWDVLSLDQLPQGSLLLAGRILERFNVCVEKSSTCPYVVINENWESFSKKYSKGFKRDLKHKINRMNRFGNWTFDVDERVEDLGSLIESIAKTEQKSRREGTKKAFFSEHKNKAFIKTFMQYCLECGWFDCSTIRIEGSPIAYLIGFVYNNKYYAYNMEFLENYHEASPGKLLLNEKLRWSFDNARRVREFDFLRGDHAIKSLWARDSRQHFRLAFFSKSLYSRFLKFCIFQIRPWIKYWRNKISRREIIDL